MTRALIAAAALFASFVASEATASAPSPLSFAEATRAVKYTANGFASYFVDGRPRVKSHCTRLSADQIDCRVSARKADFRVRFLLHVQLKPGDEDETMVFFMRNLRVLEQPR